MTTAADRLAMEHHRAATNDPCDSEATGDYECKDCLGMFHKSEVEWVDYDLHTFGDLWRCSDCDEARRG